MNDREKRIYVKLQAKLNSLMDNKELSTEGLEGYTLCLVDMEKEFYSDTTNIEGETTNLTDQKNETEA